MNVFRDPPPSSGTCEYCFTGIMYSYLLPRESSPQWTKLQLKQPLVRDLLFCLFEHLFFLSCNCHFIHAHILTCAVCHTPCETRVPFQVWQHCHWTATWKWCGTRGIRYNWAINLNDCVIAPHPKSGIVTQARREGVRTGRRVNHFHVDWRWCKGSAVTDLSGTEIW